MKKSIAIYAATAFISMQSVRAATPVVDGTINTGEYDQSSLQTTPTGFGDNQNELDGAYYSYSPNGDLHLGITGNLQPSGGFNTLMLFIDTKSGGGINSTTPGGFNHFGPSADKASRWENSTFSPGFNPDYVLELSMGPNNSNDQPPNGYYFNVIDLHEPQNSQNQNVYLGKFDPANGPNVGPTATIYARDGGQTAAGTIEHYIDNSNTAGVNGYDFGNPPGALGDPSSATHGWEFTLDSQFLGHQNGTPLRIMGAIQSGGGFFSNQFLPGLLNSPSNLGNDNFNAPTDAFYLDAFTPTRTTGGVWALDSDWTGGATPNGAEAAARLSGSTARAFDVGAGATIGYLDLEGTGSVTFNTTASGKLTLDGGSAAAIMIVNDGGPDVVNVPVMVSSDTRIRTASNSITFAGGTSLAAGKRVTLAGGGTLRLQGAIDSGAGSSFAIDAGTAVIDSDLGVVTSQPDVYVGGAGSVAAANFSTAQHLHALAINGQGTATLAAQLTSPIIYVNGGTATGTGSIVLDGNASGNGGTALIHSDGGTGDGHVAVPVSIPTNATAEVFGGATAFLDGQLSLAAGQRITKSQSGWLHITGPQSNGAGSSVAIDGGKVIFDTNFGNGLSGSSRPDLFVNLGTGSDGTADFNSNQQFNTLHVNNDGVATINQSGGTRLVQAQSLSEDSTGKVDVKDNKIIVHGGTLGTWDNTNSVYTGITADVQRGRNGGAWNGTGGILTTLAPAAAGSTTVAIAQADDIGRVGTNFGGQALSSGDVMVMYTWNGDANLDGRVNADDYFIIDSNYNKSGTSFGFEKGDFNYDGVINGDDYAQIDMGFAAQTGAFPSAPGIGGVSAVPEPASLALLTIAGVAALRRRRRSI